MKKKSRWRDYSSGNHSVNKLILMSKITLFLLFAGLLQASASYSQSARLNLELVDVSLVNVFEEIEAQTEFSFFYDNSLIELDREVTIDVSNRKIEEVLDNIFEGTDIAYEVMDRHILITRKSSGEDIVDEDNDIKKVSGIVKGAADGQPIPGVTVVVKGTRMGTITDIDGKYSLDIPEGGDVLVFSFVGMDVQEVNIENRAVIDVRLKDKTVDVDEVVVIGYGTVKKSDLTGSVAVVSPKELTKNPSSSAAKALQGKAPGVLVTQSGEPGKGVTIRVRGVGSINRGSDPIYIVDGVQVGNIDGIQPTEIESMQVLKDASASAIYGANGSNGVIIVTTKRGEAGKPKINLNAFTGVSLAPRQYNIMNADQYAAFYTMIHGERPEYGPKFREKYYGPGWQEGTNWQDQMFGTGLNQNYNLSLSGGGEDSNYNISINYTKDDGAVIKSNADRYSIRANSDFKVGKHLKIGESFNMNYGSKEIPVTHQTSIWDLNTSPLMRIYNPYYKGGFESMQAPYWEDEEGNLQQGALPEGYDGQVYVNTVNNDKPNLLCAPSLGSNRNYTLGTNANVYMQIDFTDWLMYKITPAAEIVAGRSKVWLPNFEGNRSPGTASLSESFFQSVNLNLEQQLLIKKSFKEVHNLQITGVYQARKGIFNNIEGAVSGFDFEQLNTLTNGGTGSASLKGSTSESRMLSYLGRVIYDYKGKYLATFSYRSDGVDVFAPGFRRGNFASASLAWKINEDFFKDVEQLDALKLRLGWGQTGNSSIGGGFQYLDRITDATNFSPVFGDDQHIARAQYVFYGLASKEIHWESAEMINFGLDVNLYKNRLQFNAEYYIKNNKDLLVALPVSYAFGRVDGNPWFNAGNIQNRGVELSLQWRDQIGAFSYGIISNFTTIKNEVKYLPVTDITTEFNRTVEGHSIGALYGLVSEGIIQLDETNYTPDEEGKWQQNASGRYIGYRHATHVGNIPQPGDIRYRDLNGDGDVNSLDKTIIGKTIPSYTYTLGFDCSYRNFDFNLFLYGVGDYDIFNRQRASMSSMRSQDSDENKLVDFVENYWTIDNPTTEYVRVDVGNKNVNDQMSSFWIEDGSFLRIKDIQFGYKLPQDFCAKIGIASVRVYVNASNLYCFTSYTGRDPEAFMSSDPLNSGIDNGDYPTPRSFTGGLQIGF